MSEKGSWASELSTFRSKCWPYFFLAQIWKFASRDHWKALWSIFNIAYDNIDLDKIYKTCFLCLYLYPFGLQLVFKKCRDVESYATLQVFKHRAGSIFSCFKPELKFDENSIESGLEVQKIAGKISSLGWSKTRTYNLQLRAKMPKVICARQGM